MHRLQTQPAAICHAALRCCTRQQLRASPALLSLSRSRSPTRRPARRPGRHHTRQPRSSVVAAALVCAALLRLLPAQLRPRPGAANGPAPAPAAPRAQLGIGALDAALNVRIGHHQHGRLVAAQQQDLRGWGWRHWTSVGAQGRVGSGGVSPKAGLEARPSKTRAGFCSRIVAKSGSSAPLHAGPPHRHMRRPQQATAGASHAALPVPAPCGPRPPLRLISHAGPALPKEAPASASQRLTHLLRV